MNTPGNIKSHVNYNILSNQYSLQYKIGELKLGRSTTLNFKEYQQYKMKNSIVDYWNDRSKERKGNQTSALGLPKLYIPGQAFDKIFGGNSVDIRPQGSAELIFGLKIRK